MPNRFARGKKAFGFCDRCGQRYDLGKLKPQVLKQKITNIRCCPECLDKDQPQLMLGTFPIDDPQALRNARPDVAQTESRDIQWGWGPVGMNDFAAPTPNVLAPVGYVGTVTVVLT